MFNTLYLYHIIHLTKVSVFWLDEPSPNLCLFLRCVYCCWSQWLYPQQAVTKPWMAQQDPKMRLLVFLRRIKTWVPPSAALSEGQTCTFPANHPSSQQTQSFPLTESLWYTGHSSAATEMSWVLFKLGTRSFWMERKGHICSG